MKVNNAEPKFSSQSSEPLQGSESLLIRAPIGATMVRIPAAEVSTAKEPENREICQIRESGFYGSVRVFRVFRASPPWLRRRPRGVNRCSSVVATA